MEQPGGDSRGGGGGGTITSELKDTVREAAIEVLKPVLRSATKSAAKYAVSQGPSMVKDRVAPKVQDMGGAGQLVKGVASKGGGIAEKVGGIASGIGGGKKKQEGKSPSGTGRGRRLPIQEFIDVGVDLETAYDQFTQFEDWPRFMHRVESIEQRDETTLMWHENIWGVRRSWEAEITDQTPCERIAWRSKGGTQHIGVVTFHKLSDRLTRIYITMDFQPKGLFEKSASGMRITRRALKSDLMRFKAFIELRDEATGEWRGRIEDSEVVEEQGDQDTEARGAEEEGDEEQPQAAEEDEEYAEDEEEPQASEEDEEYAEEEEQPQASAEDEDYVDEDEEDEEEEQPRARRRRAAASERDAGADEEAQEGDEPSAEEDQEEEPSAEEEPPPSPSPRRRRHRSPTSTSRGGR